MGKENLLRIGFTAWWLGAVVGVVDALRLAVLYPTSFLDFADVSGCIGTYALFGLLGWGGLLSILWGLAWFVPRWRRTQSGFSLAVQMLSVTIGFAVALRAGPLINVLSQQKFLSRHAIFSLGIVIGGWAVGWLLTSWSKPRLTAGQYAKRSFLVAGVLLLVVPLGISTLARSPRGAGDGKRPNVVLIVLDTVRADEFYRGFDKESYTPQMARLAGEGTQYRNVLATSTWTLPTHASLFTGLMPRMHGARVPNLYLAENCVTVAELLQDKGYETACMSNNPWIKPSRGMHQGFDHVWDPWGWASHVPWIKSLYDQYRHDIAVARFTGMPWGDKRSQYTVDLTDYWVSRRRPDSPPFFLFLNFMNAHLPYLPPRPYPERFLGEKDGRQPLKYGHSAGILEPEKNKINRERERGLRLLYRASIAYLDEIVGAVAGVLADAGVLDDTVFIVASDHGEHIGEHGLLGHAGPPWKTTTSVPLFIRYPPRIPAGESSDELASQVDVLPTLLQLLDIDADEHIPYPLHGVSLLDENPPREFLICEYFGDPDRDANTVGIRGNSACLLTQEHRLLWSEDGGLSLWEAAADGSYDEVEIEEPNEDLLRSLQQKLESWRQLVPMLNSSGERPEVSDEELQRLKDLGYL